MNITPEMNKWFAEKCGVAIEGNEEYPELDDKIYRSDDCSIWTISDPRCREIIRERFKVITDISYSHNEPTGFICHQHLHTQGVRGESIEEAEIACCLAIYQSQKESSDG